MQLRRTLVAGTYPVQTLALPKPGPFADADAVVEAVLRQIEEHHQARLIAVFDHLEHTWDTGGPIPPDVRAVRQVIFCLGTDVPDPEAVALCPRAIGITEKPDRFLVNYMEVPAADTNATLARWLSALAEETP